MTDAIENGDAVYELYDAMTKMCANKRATVCLDALAILIADVVFTISNSPETSAKTISTFNTKIVTTLAFMYAKEMINAQTETKQ